MLISGQKGKNVDFTLTCDSKDVHFTQKTAKSQKIQSIFGLLTE